MTRVRTLLICGSIFSAGTFGVANPVYAQVAPTEVNEKAVDEFGLERKTGRFSWSSGEIIGIGGDGSRLSIAVTGVRTPPTVEVVHPLSSLPVTLNVPRISIVDRPARHPIFAGEIDPYEQNITVEYFGGSITFRCTLSECHPEYFHWNDLDKQTGGYLFTDRNGIEIFFEPSQVTTTYPDGRQEIVSIANRVWTNNFGFMLQFAGSSGQGAFVEAVNLAEHYCTGGTQSICNTSQTTRMATLPTTLVSPLAIIDSVGGTTEVRWEAKAAMERRPPQGYPFPGLATIDKITSNYPVGIKLPGSTSEDVTISYGPYDEDWDTHDDIRVAQIVKNGVLVEYQQSAFWPFGKIVEVINPPLAINTVSGLQDPGGSTQDDIDEFRADRQGFCANAAGQWSQRLCNGGIGGVGSTDTPTIVDIPNPQYAQAPPDDAAGILQPSNIGSEIYELYITASIGGEVVSKSKSVRPSSQRYSARRRLEYVSDFVSAGVERKTEYKIDGFEEVRGVIHPEGNWVERTEYDIRGNAWMVSVGPKANSTEPQLDTALIYPIDCPLAEIARCNKPLSMTDPSDNVTEYTYNNLGQLTKEIGPAPSPGAARPTVVNEYTERTAFIKGTGSSVVAAGPAISLLTKSYTCISSPTCDANTAAADKVVTDYDYGPPTGLNNLLLRGMSVTAFNTVTNQLETLTTCYTYNYFGERIAETQPKAGLTSCP